MDPVARATTAGPAKALTHRVLGMGEQLQDRAWRLEVATEMVSLEGREEGTGNERQPGEGAAHPLKEHENQQRIFIPQQPSTDPPALGPHLALIPPCTDSFPAC